MPESINAPRNQSQVETSEHLNREKQLIEFLNSNRAIFAVLSKGSQISMSFTDDPKVTGYMEPATKSIVLGTSWMAEAGLDNKQALFVPVHEFGHADNMMEEGDRYIASFDLIRKYNEPIKVWFRQQIEAKNKTLTSKQITNLNNYIDKKYFEFWNIIDDIAINRWSLNEIPGLGRENTIERIYKDHLFPANNDQGEADYSDVPLHTQFQYYLIRNTMVSEHTSRTVIKQDVTQLIDDKKYSSIFSHEKLSIEEIIRYSTNKVTTQSTNGSKKNRILPYSTRLDVTLAFVAPTFDELFKKDFEILLSKFDENQENEASKGNQKTQERNQDDQTNQPKPQTLDEFLASLEEQGSTKDATFFDNEDPASKSLPSAFKPQTPEDLQKLKDKIKEILNNIKEDNTKQTQEEKQAQEFLQSNPEISHDLYEQYEKTKRSVQAYSDELAAFWGVLLGRQKEQRKIGNRLSETGAKLNPTAVVRNFGAIKQSGQARVFDKIVRGADEGNEKPREVRFRIVLDRSGSMGEGRKLIVLKQMYTVLMESFQNYKVRAKLSGAIKDGTYIDFRTECWGYGTTVELMKPLSPPNTQNEKGEIVGSYGQLKANLGDTNDEKAVFAVSEKINSDKQIQGKSSKKALDIIFYFTDGSPTNVASLVEALDSVDTNSVLWRAFQIESSSPLFDAIWNEKPNMRRLPVSLETMIPIVIKQLEEIIDKL